MRISKMQTTWQEQSCRASDSDSEEVGSALETTLSMIRPTMLGRITTLKGRMTDCNLQSIRTADYDVLNVI